MSHSSRLRRARPLLGTLVEISVAGNGDMHRALAAAFDEIAACQAFLSAHASGSDVQRLAATAAGEILAVDQRTWDVLGLAQELAAATQDVFDVTIAPRLAAAGYLPAELTSGRGNWHDLEMLPGHRIKPRKPLSIDLGGIAKGYAVDRAVETLLLHGATSGCVNAGGDLRLFGSDAETIYLRDPADPTQILPVIELTDGACATSAPYFSRRENAGKTLSPIVDPRDGRLLSEFESITVIAPRCIDADALTKVVILLGDDAEPLLKRYSAYALRLDKEGTVTLLPAANTAISPSATCRSSSQLATSD